jgi:hypothetical protein
MTALAGGVIVWFTIFKPPFDALFLRSTPRVSG